MFRSHAPGVVQLPFRQELASLDKQLGSLIPRGVGWRIRPVAVRPGRDELHSALAFNFGLDLIRGCIERAVLRADRPGFLDE